jgi:hypothetical protein
MDSALSNDIAKARKELDIVDHITSVTLSLIDDKNLVFSGLKRVKTAVDIAINEFIKKQNLKSMPSDMDFLYEFFCKNYGTFCGPEIKEMIESLPDITGKRVDRIIERNRSFIMIFPDFSTKILDRNVLSKYIKLSREFIDLVEKHG